VPRLIHEAIEFHVEGLLEDGKPVPPSASQAELVAVAACRVITHEHYQDSILTKA